jgi:hypothetical protein
VAIESTPEELAADKTQADSRRRVLAAFIHALVQIESEAIDHDNTQLAFTAMSARCQCEDSWKRQFKRKWKKEDCESLSKEEEATLKRLLDPVKHY